MHTLEKTHFSNCGIVVVHENEECNSTALPRYRINLPDWTSCLDRTSDDRSDNLPILHSKLGLQFLLAVGLECMSILLRPIEGVRGRQAAVDRLPPDD